MTPISDIVQAAIYYARYTDSDLSEFCWAADKMAREVTKNDQVRETPVLAAAARILAAEVVRLRGERPRIIARSKCCEAVAVVKGMPGSTKWYACSHCNKPCDVYHQENTTQPQ